MNKESGSVSVILAGVFGFFFIAASIFGIWAFAGMQDYKNNVDQKIVDANIIAVEKAETAKDAEFIEKEKSPVRTYKGPATYGSLTFSYPKTWSVYAEEETSGTVLDLYAFPGVVPGTDSEQTYALRTEISARTYDEELKGFEKNIEAGTVTATAFRPTLQPSVLGIRLDGQIEKDVQGSMVMIPLRDRTVKVYTEIPQYVGDFNNIILPSLTFIP